MISLYDEAWLSKRMVDHRGPDIFDGLTDPDMRKNRLREAIKTNNLGMIIIGAKDKKPVNWQQAFETLYGEPL